MKLVASMIVAPVEADRYLRPCVEHLLEFCDEVVLHIDGEPEDWVDEPWLRNDAKVVRSLGVPPSRFFDHEGRARQQLLDATMMRSPTHVLAIDADEFVCDGTLLRRTVEKDGAHAAWSLCMMETWGADQAGLTLRQDGGWVEHDVAVVYAPGRLRAPLRIADRALACGRVPEAVRAVRAGHAGTGILHFGWANREERVGRAERYAVADGGRFHAGSHLDSILWPDDRVRTNRWTWPTALLPYRDAILAHAGMNS